MVKIKSSASQGLISAEDDYYRSSAAIVFDLVCYKAYRVSRVLNFWKAKNLWVICSLSTTGSNIFLLIVLRNFTFQNDIWYDCSNSSVNSITVGYLQALILINYRGKLLEESRQRFMLSLPIINACLNFWYYFELKIYMGRQFLVLLQKTTCRAAFWVLECSNSKLDLYWYHQLVQTLCIRLPNEPLARQEDLIIKRLMSFSAPESSGNKRLISRAANLCSEITSQTNSRVKSHTSSLW